MVVKDLVHDDEIVQVFVAPFDELAVEENDVSQDGSAAEVLELQKVQLGEEVAEECDVGAAFEEICHFVQFDHRQGSFVRLQL